MSKTASLKNIVSARSIWIDSLHTKNLNGLLECYDKENSIFKGTTNKIVTSSRSDLEIYFERFLKRNPTVTFTRSNIKLINCAYFDTGTYVFHFENGNPIYANYQFVYKMVGYKPKIISHFSSEI